MNTISYVTLISDLLNAFEAVFPHANTLAHTAAVTNVVGAVMVAQQAAPGALDPNVAAITNTLPALVGAVQAVRAAASGAAVAPVVAAPAPLATPTASGAPAA